MSGALQATFMNQRNFGAPPVEYLVVAGGGGGGAGGTTTQAGGGGGAGGYRTASEFSVTEGVSITVTVGAGGAQATNGTNSVFSSFII